VLTPAWKTYIASFHQQHPGVTEQALEHARDRGLGTGYDWLAEAIPNGATSVLDLACGSAPLFPRLLPAAYLGIDNSPAELDLARAAGRGPVQLGDVTHLPLADASMDAVVMSMAFMLVPMDEVLAEVVRVLRPGGTFAALVPATGPLRVSDVAPLVMLSLPLGGPGRMPQQLHRGRLARRVAATGLRPGSLQRRRFPFPVRDRSDAELAVRSLYTPGVSPAARERAVDWLARLGPRELPVPLMRFTATKSG
jgi:SAM-dependent methyltransferase